jgi:general secretion pathway protein E
MTAAMIKESIPASLLNELRAQVPGGEALWEALERKLTVSPTACLARLGVTLDLATLNMEELHRLTPDFGLLPYPEAQRRKCLIARFGEKTDEEEPPICVFSDPFDLALPTWIETRLGVTPAWRLAHPSDLVAYLAVQEEKLRAIDGALGNMAESETASDDIEDLSFSTISRDASPVVRLVNSTLFDAMKVMASDIHLKTAAQSLKVKYRIDGVLTTVAEIAGIDIAEQVVSRIKVMAELDIAERRVPQDGRFKLSVAGSGIDFRVSVMPSLFGEDVVIRILDKRALTDQLQGLRLDHLGFSTETLAAIRRLAREPYGMLLVTGPTGSGKTTTLYGALNEINDGRDSIVTIEDPVEYQLPDILQIPVNEKKGLTFARGLRSILRHDPDKILVGEIRDPETAQIAVQSALTGHLVFTSVHANNVFDVLGRFLHMGLDAYSFVSALNGILAQRLVRVVCSECAVEYHPEASELEEAGIRLEQLIGAKLRHGRGCGNCRGTGYKGRKAIGEILRLNDEIRELIIKRAPIRHIKEAARANGTRFLRESAVDLALSGATTLEEINRVTFSE